MPKPMQSNGRGSMRLTLLALMLTSLLPGCAILGKGTERVRYLDTSCEAFRPITFSSRDTPETVDEVKAHNRAYDALCPAK